MSWRYRCESCNEVSGWMGRVDAERTRDAHQAARHPGMKPAGEHLESNAERMDPRLWLYVLAGCAALGILRWIINL